VTAQIIVDNPVDTSVLGAYIVTYTVTDSSGNAATPVTRSVRVEARTGAGGGGGGVIGFWMLIILAVAACLERARQNQRLVRSRQ